MRYLFSVILFLLLFTKQGVLAQTGEIRGVVIEKSTGEPLTGASVMIESLKTGAIVDLDGNYSIKAPPGVYTLRFSYISFNTPELTDVRVEEGKVTEANAVMEEATNDLKLFLG